MTRLPIDSRLSVDRPDLPEYELNRYCAVPGCHEVREYGGGHHIFRRSAGYPSWHVELVDGEVIGNRIGLCPMHHHLVTINVTRIVYQHHNFWWVDENGALSEMDWQPPREAAVIQEAHDDVAIEPGHDCPTCRRRVPLPKKKSSPKTAVFSTRVPVADTEAFAEIVDAAAEHHGLKDRPHHRYWVLLYGATLLLQTPKGELPVG